MRILILGAGRLGSVLGLRWAAHEHEVIWAVRETGKPTLRGLAGHRNAQVVSSDKAPDDTDIVVVATPAKAALHAIDRIGGARGRIVIECTNPLSFDDDGVFIAHRDVPLVAERIAAQDATARVVKTLNQLGSDVVVDPSRFDTAPLMYVAGDDDEAKSTVSTLVVELGFDAQDAGPLRNAFALEAMALLWMHGAMTRQKGRHSSFLLQQATK